MKTLITGAAGQVGRELQESGPENWQIFALTRAELDITDEAAVRNAFQAHKPDLVINTAAYTSVDRAENEKDRAFSINSNGAAIIARATAEAQARLIHLSTDFIFDGSRSSPYLPDNRPNPLSVYGASKLGGEEAVLQGTEGKALILRTSWLYSRHGDNFVNNMVRLMAERDALNVVADQVGTPTCAGGLARAIWKLVKLSGIEGIYHWTDAGVASWYDFSVAIQEEAYRLGFLQKVIPVIPVRTADYPTPAQRPPYSVLDKTATWDLLGSPSHHWRRALRLMLEKGGNFERS